MNNYILKITKRYHRLSSEWQTLLGIVFHFLSECAGYIKSITKRQTPSFRVLDKALKKRDRALREQIVARVDVEWRKMVHALNGPVIVLDDQCRLVEANEAAIKHFKNGDEIIEGLHIVDILEGEIWQKQIASLIETLKEGKDNIARATFDGWLVAAFSSSEMINKFKYTIICSEDIYGK